MKIFALFFFVYPFTICTIIKYKSLEVFISEKHHKEELSDRFTTTVDTFLSFGYIYNFKEIPLDNLYKSIDEKFNLRLGCDKSFSICALSRFHDNHPEGSYILEIDHISLKDKNRIVKKIDQYYTHDWFDIFTPSYRITWSNNKLMLLLVDIGAPIHLHETLQLKN
jgi:hypothetical protein